MLTARFLVFAQAMQSLTGGILTTSHRLPPTHRPPTPPTHFPPTNHQPPTTNHQSFKHHYSLPTTHSNTATHYPLLIRTPLPTTPHSFKQIIQSLTVCVMHDVDTFDGRFLRESMKEAFDDPKKAD